MHKKSFLSLIIMSALLVGCSLKGTPVGEYSFIMGSTKGSHFGVYLNLTNEETKAPEVSSDISVPSVSESTSENVTSEETSVVQHTYYKFTFKYENVTVDNTSTSEISTSEDSTSEVSESTSEGDVASILQNVEGGYYIKDDGLTLAIDIYIWNAIVLPSEFLDDFLVIKLNSNYSEVNINIPVSIDDAFEKIIAKWEGRDPNAHTVDITLQKQ